MWLKDLAQASAAGQAIKIFVDLIKAEENAVQLLDRKLAAPIKTKETWDVPLWDATDHVAAVDRFLVRDEERMQERKSGVARLTSA